MKLLYATFANEEEAIKIVRVLLAEKLIACANISASTSLYNWQGEQKQEKEAIMFAKTSADKTEAAIARIKELHSYDLPCILVLPVEAGLPEFIKWVESQII